MPGGPELRRRLDSVLEVLYFLFNEGCAAHEGEELIRQDLCMEALRLAVRGHLLMELGRRGEAAACFRGLGDGRARSRSGGS